ncbi:MAG TPA: CaiB/BaiF CoA-transferase family protein [Candidatus Binataceae bacterium]|nr:CaiB/BaiF CoA-transferase family protein [Candidatus Binataceae bacterium]
MSEGKAASPAPVRRALDGIKVVAFEASVAAPHCSRMLADMGAEVIKIERPGEGDLIRHWDSAVHGLSSGYVWLNWNKRSLAIDVKQPAGKEVILKLVAQADVFLENFAPGVVERLGLGPADLCQLNARLIYCSLSGYGQQGPYRDVKAYDLLVQGESGIIATTGYKDQMARAGIAIADLTSSMYAALSIMMALFQRERSGRGQTIDLSMFEAMTAWLGYFPHYYWHRGEEPERTGMRHPYITPYGPYRAGDGVWVSVAVATAQDWVKFCKLVLQRPDLLEDARFDTVEHRRHNRAVLEEIVERLFLTQPHQEWLARLRAADMAYGLVRGIGEVLNHPQIEARQMIGEVDSPVGRLPVMRSPMRLSDSPPRFDRIPDLGEDSEAILRELGYDDAAIGKLRQDKVI